jgi:glyoxylase-like metal-dependent hydrolase (beta-lactamase superfamily II)
VADNFADVLEHPADYDLPCLWYDPIPVDRRLTLGEPFCWEEYTFTLYPLPGHTLYAVAVAFEVDGKRVLATGDQYQGDDGLLWNYVYQNRYRIGDYAETARLYREQRPDLILSGHWRPLWVREGYLESIVKQADAIEELQRELLPLVPDLGAEGFLARIQPYTAAGQGGDVLEFEVEVHNPFPQPERVELHIVTPEGWPAVPDPAPFLIENFSLVQVRVVLPVGRRLERARIAVDVTIGDQRFGQQAEALVSSA